MQVWSDAVAGRHDVRFIATADRESLAEHAPEVLARRGLFARLPIDIEFRSAAAVNLPALPRALRVIEPAERLALCIEAFNRVARRASPARLPPAHAWRSTISTRAARDLEEAIERAPGWAAAHFEHGKLWLRRDDMARAAEAFARADRAHAVVHVGLGQSGCDARRAGSHRRSARSVRDRRSRRIRPIAQALNNVGVVRRELGRLDDSVAAFRQRHRAGARARLRPLQSWAYAVSAGPLSGSALGVCGGSTARRGSQPRAGDAPRDVPAGNRRRPGRVGGSAQRNDGAAARVQVASFSPTRRRSLGRC